MYKNYSHSIFCPILLKNQQVLLLQNKMDANLDHSSFREHRVLCIKTDPSIYIHFIIHLFIDYDFPVFNYHLISFVVILLRFVLELV